MGVQRVDWLWNAGKAVLQYYQAAIRVWLHGVWGFTVVTSHDHNAVRRGKYRRPQRIKKVGAVVRLSSRALVLTETIGCIERIPPTRTDGARKQEGTIFDTNILITKRGRWRRFGSR